MPEPSFLDRFRSSVEDLAGMAPTPDRRLGIAVSGGPDSLALLVLAYQAYPLAIAASTVDHQLRPEAAAEARYVARFCEDRKIPHEILHPAKKISGNMQSAARNARYALLEEWRQRNSIGWVATAHHADDQFETIMMRLLRGSGVDGLAAIRPVNGHVIRPMLSFRKAELEAIIESEGVEAISDPSNFDDSFDRARLRKSLRNFAPIEADRIGQTAKAMRQASEALQWVVQQESELAIIEDGETVELALRKYPAEVLRRLVLACLARLEPGSQPRSRTVDRAIVALSDGKKTMIGKIVVKPQPSGNWQFSVAPERKTG